MVESGSQGLKQWPNYERDIRTDFEAALGEAPGKLVGISIMTHSNSENAQRQKQGWYGKISLQ